MSITQLTEYLLWKSIKDKEIPRSDNNKDIKQEFLVDKQEILDNDMICRVCTSPADIPITDKIDDTLIITAIRTVANISITDADFYPKYVCKLCLGELKIAFLFKKKCEVSDMVFRKAISSETILVTDSQPIVKHDFSLTLNQIKKNKNKPTISVKTDATYDIEFDTQETQIELPIQEIVPITYVSPSSHRNRKKKTSKEDDESCDDYNNEDIPSPTPTIVESHSITKTISQPKQRKRKKRTLFSKAKDRHIVKLLKNNPETDHLELCKVNSKNDISEVRTKKSRTKLRVHKCKRCDLKFETKEEFQKHRKANNCVHHACPLCGKLVLNLAAHEKVVHSRTNKYTCHQCGKVYYSSGSLINHMHKHKETKEYFCEHCPYSGKRKSYLVCHMRVHTGEHRYLCSMCPLKFTNPSNLTKHQLVHYNKKFECSECKRLFRQERNLKEHFDAAHLNIRYRCTICGKDLSSRKKLLSHELRVHKREKHKLFEEVQRVVVGNDNDC